jgi:SPP1 family predicted phage head-tail adaptor
MTTAGDLDRRITIERSTFGDDGYGNPVYEWEPLATVAASRADVSDTERVAYGGIVSELISRFVIRAGGPAGTVKPVDRLAYDGRIWDIMGVKEARAGRKRFLEITAKAEG